MDAGRSDRGGSLRPVAGTPAEVERLLAEWLEGDSAPPLSVRTSGSSGDPKEVALSRRAVVASAWATMHRLGGTGQWVLALPAHYVAGLQVLVRSILAGSRPVALSEHASLRAAVGAMEDSRRYLAIVPTQLHRLLVDPAAVEALTSFDAVLLGGAAAVPDLLRRAREKGIEIVTTYGMSETCGGCVYDGVPLDGVDVTLEESGRVLLAGPVLFDGYVDDGALTAQVLRGGWLHTPDLGRFDEQGRLEVVGRVDDVAISGGVNVPLPAVERRLLAHPAVHQAAVVGVPDDEWGTRVLAVVVTAHGAVPPSLSELRDFVGQMHPRAWAPHGVVFADALPLLDSGKVDRLRLRREWSRARA